MRGLMIGERYRLDEPLGSGGMGEVHRGTDILLGRPVAIKLIKKAHIGDDEVVRRFLRESRITARLDHPGVPAIYGQGQIADATHPLDGRLYLAMQYIDGWSIEDLAATYEPLPIAWAAAITAQVCAVLHYAHQRQVIHRDLKPSNLMITSDGFVKVLDFGLATALGDPTQSKISQTGIPVGTWLYMAPEQFGGGNEIGPATDLYALGLVLHRMIAGAPLFEGRSFADTAAGHIFQDPSPLRPLRADVPEEIEQLVLHMLAKLPSDRPDSAYEVFRRLRPYATGLTDLPGAITSEPTATRMYTDVFACSAPLSASAPAFTRGDLDRARRRASGLARASKHGEAVDLLLDVADKAAMSFGANHSDVFAVRRAAAELMLGDGRYAEAADAFADLASDLARRDGKDDEQVLNLRQQEADCLVYASQPNLALAKLQDLMADQVRVFGASDNRTYELRQRISLLLNGIGRTAEAVDTLEELVAAASTEFGPEHGRTRALRNDLERMKKKL
ncbi:serine/threonine-protein kinase [Nocardia sp. alder85J]|uniref:serine/threonine-protein kinase n=1 Tax=Nocardia sp. alder85J TaxID=2862949 RepID=UPI001CD3FCA5|nr:serine/threonine-protein kinase [Nocardia sp. alder85J]MCX4092080.1 serine/threonine-protein kinase [Nocardia sp. alder85J]